MAAVFNTLLAKIGLSRKPLDTLATEEVRISQIQAAYRCLLDRDAEPEGQAHWSAFLREGGRHEELLLNIVRSAEFQRRLDASVQPGDPTTDANQIRAAYLCILGREAEPAGLTHWSAYLRDNGSYDGLLRSFILSAEFQRRLSSSTSKVVPATEQSPAPVSRGKFAVLGNHQAAQMAHCIQALTGAEMPLSQWINEDQLLATENARAQLLELFRTHERVFMQPALWNALAKRHPELRDRVVLFPSISFSAFHPDFVALRSKSTGANVQGPCGDYSHSCLAFLGWKAGLTVEETHQLYKIDNYQRLGFFQYWQRSATSLINAGKEADLELAVFVDEWLARGCFMHSVHNPKLHVMADIARTLLQRNSIDVVAGNPCEYAQDPLANSVVWPVYPEIAEKLNIQDNYSNFDWHERNYTFKLQASASLITQQVQTLKLKEFIEQSFAIYSSHAADDLICDRLGLLGYPELLADLQAQARAVNSTEQANLSPSKNPSLDATPHSSRWDAGDFAVLGNCQAGHMARCLQALVGGKMPKQEWVTTEMLSDWESGSSLEPLFARYKKVFMQPWIWAAIAQRYADYKNQVVLYPSIGFMAYHPDLVPVVVKRTGTAFEDGPAMRCNSALTFLGWQAGLSASETAGLFRRDIYQKLGFFDFWKTSATVLLEEGQAAELPLEELLIQWRRQGCFMHCHVHPKLFVIADIARVLLKRLDIPMAAGDPIEFTHDYLANGIVWPVYPEVGEVLGCSGSYAFKLGSLYYSPDSPVHVLGLEAFIEKSFAAYAKYSRDELVCPRLESEGFRALLSQLQSGKEILAPVVKDAPAAKAQAYPNSINSSKGHPYHGLPAERFWRHAVENVRPDQVDPVIRTKFQINPVTRIATAGSCFAQRISERLGDRGFNFLQTEIPPGEMAAAEAARLNYGAFTARFGFLYTARQLRQLIERAYGDYTPADSVWQLENGRFVDPFRPRIEPDGFHSVEELENSRTQHLAAVRRMFETLDVFIFTLGLTEAWRDKTNDAVLPIAPGVAGGTLDFERYEFVNFTVSEVDDDLQKFVAYLSKVNPAARVILTVSPVPLVATYADRHVLASTMYSKSVLRVAAEQVAQRHPHCDYFPSYEIIAGSFNRGRYFGDDLRAVTPAGVDHVMRLFFGHYAPTADSETIDAEMLAEARSNISYLCDEELLSAAGP